MPTLYRCIACQGKSEELPDRKFYVNPPITGMTSHGMGFPMPGLPTLADVWCDVCLAKAAPAVKSAHDQAIAARDAAIADVVAQVAAGREVESVVLSVSHQIAIKQAAPAEG
jgi:hypothetical protein